MQKLTRTLIAFIFTVCFTNFQSPVWAADGDLDTSFDTDGIQTANFAGSQGNDAQSVLLQSDGKIVVVGKSFAAPDNVDRIAITRFNVNGSVDTSFGEDGKTISNFFQDADAAGFKGFRATSAVLQSDGKILVAGYVDPLGSGSDFAIARYTADGVLDETFGDTEIGGLTVTDFADSNDYANDVVVQGDGKIVVVGYTNNSTEDFAIARYSAYGVLDVTFGTDGKKTEDIDSQNNVANSVALQNINGVQYIIIAGTSNNGTDRDFVIASYIDNGNLYGLTTTDFAGSNDYANDVVVQNDDKIVVVGYSDNSSHSDFAIARYTAFGDLEVQLTTDIGSQDNILTSVVLQSDGKIVTAGYTYNGTDSDFVVVRYNTDGSLDTNFGVGGVATREYFGFSDRAYDIVLQSDDKIVVAGEISSDFSEFLVVRYLNTISSSNAQIWVGAQSISCPAPNPWIKEQLGFASSVQPVLVSAENTIGKSITQGSYDSLKSSGVVFDTVSKKVSTATETLPIYGCKDKLLSGKLNQPIQFIAGGYTLQSDAHGYINTADLKWHDTNGVTLYTNTAAFMHTVKFTKTGKYVVVLTEQPDTSRGLIPTYGVRSVRFVININ